MITNRTASGRIVASTGRKAKFTISSMEEAAKVKWHCSKCRKRKTAANFYLRPTKYGGKIRRSNVWCKQCHSQHASNDWKVKVTRRWYWINKYKIAKGCSVCGYNNHAVCLDFHHVEQKTDNINSIKSGKLQKLFKEIRKCVLLCANCHRIEHYKKGWR